MKEIVSLSALLSIKKKPKPTGQSWFWTVAVYPGSQHKNAGCACFGSISELLADIDTSRKSDFDSGFSDQEQTDLPGNTVNVVQWSRILGLGSEKSPILQWHSDCIFMACRMGGMGISIDALIGKAAADEIVSVNFLLNLKTKLAH